ncbi:MAG: LmbE family protein, partial [Saprospiraceae bacterium]|nr:LmbE family protein [Saprospiraceae bacterium]
WWFYGGREEFAKADKSNLVSVDVGGFYPTLGISNNEISGLARSKHRSQGFGSSGARGSYQEYLELVNGDLPADRENIFDGINTSWTRVRGGEQIKAIMDKVMADFDFTNPSASVPDLLEAYSALQSIEDTHWKNIKSKHLKEIIVQCMGLFIEATTDQQQTTYGDTVELQLEVTSRSELPLEIIHFTIDDSLYALGKSLEPFVENKWFRTIPIQSDIEFSNPYWLNEESPIGIYTVSDPALRNKPQSDAAFSADILLNIDGTKLNFTRDVIYKTVEPDYGEIREPFVVIPPATMRFDKEMYLFSNETEQSIDVSVRATKDNLNGTLTLNVPDDWNVEPASIEVNIPNKGMEKSFRFKLISPDNISEGQVNAKFTMGSESYNKTLINIRYDHIPLQTILLPASSKIVKVPLKKGGTQIAYIMGAGDKMPESLQSVGYQVDLIETKQLNAIDLSKYNALVIGIRAYNTLDDLWLYNQNLYDYVQKGGTMVVQYNTSRRLNYEKLSPLPLKLSRKRVTDEFAEMRILAKDHVVINQPNKISKQDFDGWVQERGLYFPDEWDSAFTPILSSNDKGEDPLDGSLLVAPYGEGYFVYTSISWFRQLPAGVPGAYRLFANILALSSPNDKP